MKPKTFSPVVNRATRCSGRVPGTEASGNPSAAWQIAGGYAYQHAFITSATVAAALGASVAQVPGHTFSLWNRYQISPRVGAGVGMIYRSDMFAAIDNTVTLRHDMRNAAGGILASVLSITCPGGAGRSDLQTVPNPVIQSCQILDDAKAVKKIEVVDSILLRQGQHFSYLFSSNAHAARISAKRHLLTSAMSSTLILQFAPSVLDAFAPFANICAIRRCLRSNILHSTFGWLPNLPNYAQLQRQKEAIPFGIRENLRNSRMAFAVSPVQLPQNQFLLTKPGYGL
jgi:hypothetical protein